MKKNSIITVQNIPITVLSRDNDDYICITDMAAAKAGNARAADVINKELAQKPYHIGIPGNVGADL